MSGLARPPRSHATSDDVARAWDAEAPTYDEAADHGMRDPDVRAAWMSVLPAAVGEAPRDVLEPGCGTATVGLLLAGLGHRVRGIDLSPGMLGRARDKASAAGLDVVLDLGDAQHPDGAAGSVDVVVCRHVLWALPDPAEALRRWCELLRRPGRLVLVEGSWSTGVGLRATEVTGLLAGLGLRGHVTVLTDPALWGRAIEDERFLVTAQLLR